MIFVIFDIEARRVTTRETTATGDRFNGAIATALVAVAKLTEAVEIACKPAAMPTTKLGAQRSTPRREEMLLSIWLSDLFVSPTMRDIICIRFFLAILAVMPASPAGSQTIPDGLITQELERAQTEPDSTTEVVINAPADYVFTFLTTRLQDYVADANALEFDHSGSSRSDQLGEGSVRTATMQNGELLVQRFLLMDPPREFAYHTDMQRSTLEAPLQYSVGRYRLTELNEQANPVKRRGHLPGHQSAIRVCCAKGIQLCPQAGFRASGRHYQQRLHRRKRLLTGKPGST